ncbi:MAG: hypothetical protein COA79_02630 [Planctomycetota bacterium]|nr:MAG: hypothetical protein COA79_02630 [Planctomycetota bacterium]
MIYFVFLFKVILSEDKEIIGPTPSATLLLEYTNRFRMNPKAEAQIIMTFLKNYRGKNIEYLAMWNGTAKGGGLIRTFRPRIDFKIFKEEVEKIPSSQPLVFNLQLIQSANSHSKYMQSNDIQTHSEIKNKKHFSGISPFHRTRIAKYPGRFVGENAFLHGKNPWYCHLGFLIDWGPGPGGMQPGRGHRVNLARSIFKEIGIGTIKYKWRRFDEISTTQNFGIVSVKDRFVGGVIYNDKNKNNFYDIGEGVGDVSIMASDGSTCKSWASGAFTLKLKSAKGMTITATYLEIKKETKISSGNNNIKLDWIVPSKERILYLSEKLNVLEKEPTSKDLLTNLYIASRSGLILKEESNNKIKSHIKEIKITLEPIFLELHQLIKKQELKSLNLLLLKIKRKFIKSDFVFIGKEINLLKSSIKRFLDLENRVLKTSNARSLQRLRLQSKKTLKKIHKIKQTLFYKEFLPHWDNLIKEIKSLPF